MHNAYLIQTNSISLIDLLNVFVDENFISRYLSIWRYLQICLFSYSQRKILGLSGKNQGLIIIDWNKQKSFFYLHKWFNSYRWTYSICTVETMMRVAFQPILNCYRNPRTIYSINRTILTCIILSKSLTCGHTINVEMLFFKKL